MATESAEERSGWGMTAVRMALGALMISHGWPKLLAIVGTGHYLQALGFHPGIAWAWLVTIVELGGGIALLTGILVRPAAALFAIEMAVAIVKVNGRRGYYWPQGGWEMPLLLIVLAVAVAFTAPEVWPGRARAGI